MRARAGLCDVRVRAAREAADQWGACARAAGAASSLLRPELREVNRGDH